MERLKNIALFLLTIIACCLSTLLLFQQQKFAKDKRDQGFEAQADSLYRAQLYQYSLTYGDLVDVPVRKEMILTDSSQKSMTMASLIKKRTYIFHFDETNCFTCVEKYIPFLQKLSKKLGPGKVVIIGSYSNSANLFIALQPFKLSGLQAYNLPPAYLGNSRVARLNMPYIFETDSLLQTSRFYIPEKNMPELSVLYHKQTPD